MALTMVGDTDQMLMRFAGAKPEILGQEIVDLIPDIKTIKLKINYRSTQEIIEQCQKLIAHNYSNQGGPYSQSIFKEIEPRPGAPKGSEISFSDFDNIEDETQSVTETIEHLLQGSYEPQDIFIGARTKAQLGYLEGSLIEAKIPFINICGGSFWNSKHIQDVLAYVKLAYDNSDKEAFKRIYNISSKDFEQPFNTKDKKKGDYNSHRWLAGKGLFLSTCDNCYSNIHLAESNKNGWRWQPGIDDLKDLLDTISFALAEGGVSKTIQIVIDHCYEKWMIEEGLLVPGEDGTRLDDLSTMQDISSDFDTTEDFFEYVDKCVKVSEDAKNGDWNEYVILSTIHRLKGLERKVVFGIGWSEGFDKEDQPIGILPHTYSLRQPPQFGVLPTNGMGRIEDERCLAYVLVSRAKELVFLSSIRQYKNSQMYPSQFIEELLNDYQSS
ncbi:MAG TPA: ATP-dependent helicase [bacterium]|nr:ATP-dependent helicase [bacterium]